MKIVKNRPFRRTVDVKFPAADGQGTEEQSFMGHFIALTTDEAAEYQLHNAAAREAFLTRVFLGFEGIEDDMEPGDVPWPNTPENVAALIKDPFVQPALVQAYIAALAGVARKN